MTSLDQWLAQLGHGGGLAIALAVAVLLGLRHATDPDHLTALSTLTLSEDRSGAGRAGLLGASWGLGHATTLVLFGVPALLLSGFMPGWAQRGSEAAIGLVIVALAARLLWRWRSGCFHAHPHRHGASWHNHPHGHGRRHGVSETASADVQGMHDHPHEERIGRSPLVAYGIGLIHGMGGSAAVTLLLIGAIPDRVEATFALVLFALATALSMCVLSVAFGSVVANRSVAGRLEATIPLLGVLSLAFGVFYGLAAI